MSNLPQLKPIDKHNLDELLVTHRYEYQQVTDKLPALREAMTKAKENIEVVSSNASLQIRKKMEESGQKVTESVIAAHIKLEPAYTQAFDAWLSARRLYEEAEQLEKAFIHQEQAIKGLIQLYGNGYWSLSSLEKYEAPPESQDGGSGFKERTPPSPEPAPVTPAPASDSVPLTPTPKVPVAPDIAGDTSASPDGTKDNIPTQS